MLRGVTPVARYQPCFTISGLKAELKSLLSSNKENIDNDYVSIIAIHIIIILLPSPSICMCCVCVMYEWWLVLVVEDDSVAYFF